ncbi:MAG: DNA translocase FtsK, partial [Nitrospirae bacterium]
IEGKITHVYPGPVVTMFEFEPAPGVKINKITSLSDDLALSLKAMSVRVSPIPGKAALGIEVPNKHTETVYIKDILSSDKFKNSRSLLTLALGKDIFGNPIVTDLSKMPHLLVAGATGSGKSVAINSMILSLLYRATPREVRMLMIDPKMLELSIYNEIPHLIMPVITTPKDAAKALKRIVFEMEHRYRLLAEKGVRNIEGFNKKIASEDEFMPYIVVIIDELADLMLISKREVEEPIARLAQMARAAGIHMILATQRPSVDVITGVIKANFPSRISFQVSSKVDSRTILDSIGAEKLLGRGDMLFITPGSKMMRVHGAYVSEDEVNRIVDFLKEQESPEYILSLD